MASEAKLTIRLLSNTLFTAGTALTSFGILHLLKKGINATTTFIEYLNKYADKKNEQMIGNREVTREENREEIRRIFTMEEFKKHVTNVFKFAIIVVIGASFKKISYVIEHENIGKFFDDFYKG